MTDKLKQLIEDNKEVTFRCVPAGSGKGEFVIKTSSTLKTKATKEDLEEVKSRLGEYAEEFIEFYQNFNGAIFHHDERTMVSAVEIYSIEWWDRFTNDMKQWYEDAIEFGDEELKDRLDWLDNCIAFAEPSDSANYFVIALQGKHAGKIIYIDHDGAEVVVYADTFNGFLEKYLTDPIKEMDFFGCYVRYDDGETDIQWIPTKYI